jgi:autotransporter-associated beta strand protein
MHKTSRPRTSAFLCAGFGGLLQSSAAAAADSANDAPLLNGTVNVPLLLCVSAIFLFLFFTRVLIRGAAVDDACRRVGREVCLHMLIVGIVGHWIVDRCRDLSAIVAGVSLAKFRRAVEYAPVMLLKGAMALTGGARARRRALHWAFTWVAIAAIVLGGTPGFAATLVWDVNGVTAGTGGTGVWTTDVSPTNWDNGTTFQTWLNGNDIALFGGTPGTVTLNTPITAGGLIFDSNGYILNSNTGADVLTLQSAAGLGPALLQVTKLSHTATINSTIAGTDGLFKTGLGNVVLNGTNTYTGFTVINNGTLTISNASGLGTSNSTVVVNGNRTFGFSGGTLRVTGGQSGLTFTRDISVAGSGVNTLGAALISIGNNTFTGDLTFAASGETRIAAVGGNTTFNGRVTLGTSDNLRYFYGNGNFIINGLVTGGGAGTQGIFRQSSGITSTLVLNNQNNNFVSNVRADSGTIRVSHGGALGLSTGSAAINGSGGIFEFRVAAADIASFATRNVSLATGSFTLFADHSVGGSDINQTIVFSQLTQTNNRTLTVSGRNGYGITFAALAGSGNGANSDFFTNNMNGLLTFTGNLWNEQNTTARTLTMAGNSETLVTGNILASGAAHIVNKTGTGVLTIGGTTSTVSGSMRASQGTISVGNMGAIGTGQLFLGNVATSAGTFTYTGAGEASSHGIVINTSTLNAYINASGSGALQLNGPITFNATTGTKTLVLGGTSTAANEITSPIGDSAITGFTNVQKIGSGTWVLSGINTFTGTGLAVAGGTIRIRDTYLFGASRNVLLDNLAITFNVDSFTQAAGGTFEYAGDGANPSAELVGALVPSAGAGTVLLTPGVGGTAALTFASLGAVGSGTGLNFVTTVGNTITVTAATNTNGIIDPRLYFNGADFAASTAGVIGAASYTSATTPLTAGNVLPYSIDGSFIQNASVTATAGLKFNGAQTLALDPSVVLTINNGANTAGGIIATGGASQILAGAGSAITNGVATGSADLAIRVNGSGDSLTIAAPIVNGGAGSLSLVKNGAGLLVLSGANGASTFTGGVVINEGTLQLAAGATLGAVDNNLTIRQGATLDLNGVSVGSLASGGLNALDGAGSITNTAASTTSILRVGNNGGSGYFTGVLSDGSTTALLSLAKGGGGTLSLTGQNTFTGAVQINAGVLAVTSLADIGTASALGKGNATSDATNAASLIFNGAATGTLLYTGSNATIFQETQTPSVRTNRLFTLAGNAIIESSGQYGNNVLATGNANHASLIFYNTAAVVFAGTGARSLTLGGTSIGDNEMAIRLIDNPGGGALSLTKANAGLWILNPATSNTYTGATTITGGALQVAAEGASALGLPTTSNLVINGGVLQTSGTFARALGTNPNEVQFTGNGGFSASTSKLAVNLGGGTTWNLGAAPTNFSTLILSSMTALADVEILNPINLGTGARTIQVDDNTSTGMDFATVSGVISGGAGGTLTKSGAGVLYLGNANTYVGNTTISAGALVVTSLGAAGATSSSIGTNVGGGTLSLGNGAYLMYVGGGEITSRTISITSTTTGPTIDASGYGALTIGTAAVNMITGSGAKTLTLRGMNSDANTIVGNLQPVGGTLTVTKSDGGTWILTGNNTFTGTLTLGGGWLGASSATALGASGTGTIAFSNGGLFASGGAPLTIARAVSFVSNGTSLFGGDQSLTFTGTITLPDGADGESWTLNNTVNGGTVTLNPGGAGSGTITNSEATATDTRTLTFAGTGAYNVLGALVNHTVTDVAADGLGVTISGSNTLSVTLGGTGTSTYTRNTTLTQGTLILNKASGALGAFTATNNVLSFNGGVLRSIFAGGTTIGNRTNLGTSYALVDGAQSLTFAGTFVNSGGSRTLQNDITGPALLTLSGTVALSGDATSRTLTLQGSGTTNITGIVTNSTSTATASALAYSGNGVLRLTNSGANTAAGALTVNRGTVALRGTTGGNWAGAVNINGTGTLSLDNSLGETVVTGGRVLDSATITMNGGTLDFAGDGDGTSESIGTLTVNNIMGRLTMSGAGPNVLTIGTMNFANTGSSLDLSSITGLGATNRVVFTTLGTNAALVGGIATRVMLTGNFATYSAGDVAVFSAYNVSNDLTAALAGDTMDLTANANITLSRTLNAMRINGSGLTIGGGTGRVLTLTAGNVLNMVGNNTLAVEQINLPGSSYFQVDGATTLTVSSVLINNSGALAKSGTGTLELTSRNYYGSTTNVQGGLLKLSGGANTILPLVQILNVAPGATVDLNGNLQYVGAINGTSSNALPGTAGTVTNSGALTTFVTSGAGNNGTFGGQVTGAIRFVRIGGNTLTLGMAQTYTGPTALIGGTTTLENDATILNSTAIDLHYATLNLSNNTGLQTDLANRIGDSIPLTLRGGTITFAGKALNASSETFGALTIAEGANTINVNTGNAGTYFSADVTFASLARSAGTTVNFATANNTLGVIDNNPRVLFDAPLSVGSNGILAPWAVVNATHFAAYNPAMGVAAVGTIGFDDYTNFLAGGTATNPAALAAGNVVNLQATANLVTTLSANTTLSLLRLSGGFTNDIAFTTGNEVINLQAGGLLRSNEAFASTIGTEALRGALTAGGTETSGVRELFVYNAQNTLTINSVIQDNGLGNSVMLVRSGGGTTRVTAANTYTGGTVVNQGTLTLAAAGLNGIANHVVLPAGGLTINGGTVTMLTNQGQIDASNVVTLNGSSTLTLVGANTLNSLVFNNNGGTGNPTVNLGTMLTLTGATPITLSSMNAATLPVITGGTLVLSGGTKTLDVGAPTLFGSVYSDIRSALNIASIITGDATINKTGVGLLQLSAQNTFTGALNVLQGGIVLGANSTGTVPTTMATSPLGLGAVTMSAGTVILADDNSRTVANAMTFAGNPIFRNTGATTDTLTLNGDLTFATLGTSGVVLNVDTPYLNVVLGGQIINIGSVTSIGGTGPNTISKTGLGNLTGINLTGINAATPINLTGLTNTNFVLLHDGDGTTSFETINLGTVTWEPVNDVLAFTVDRAGAGAYFPTAAFKTLALSSLNSSVLPRGMSVTNNNGYGLLVPNAISLATVATDTGPTYSVSTISSSLQNPGFTLSGVLSGGPTGATARTFIKAGAGVLVLSNSGNTFGGGGSIIDITDGLLQVAADGALGNASNVVRISANNAAEGLRITGTFATSRTIDLANAASGIDVTGSNTFTLNSPFTYSTATNALTKNDLGTLVLTQSQAGWDGIMTVNQGVLRITHADALGSTVGGTTFGNVGGALELSGGLTVAEPISFNSGDNATTNGVNGGGGVRAVSGVNRLTGPIAMVTGAQSTNDRSRAGTFTADFGATLHIDGVVTGSVGNGTGRDSWIGIGGAGDGFINTAMALTGTLDTNRFFSINKFGTGTWTITAANAHPGTRVMINQGTLVLSGAGSLGTPTAGQETAPTVYFSPAGTLKLDNISQAVSNRLGGRSISLSSGDINILGNDSNLVAETVANFNVREGLSKITLDADPAQQLNFTASGTLTRVAGATLLIRGDQLETAAGNGVATFTGNAWAFTGPQTGATDTFNKGILAWVLGDTNLAGGGVGFLTADSAGANTGTSILRFLNTNEQVSDFSTANANVNLTAAQTLGTVASYNSLRLASGGAVSLAYVPLSLSSGGLLALSGNGGVSGFSGVSYLTSVSNAELILHAVGNLDLNVPIAGTTGAVTKSGAGTLTLTAGNTNHGSVYINDGTLKLGGGDQTILPGRSLQLNEGGTLDLNGTVQHFNFLESRLTQANARSDQFPANAGGIVSNSSAGQATLALATGNVTFAGAIQGNIAVTRSNAAAAFQDWNLYSDQTYTGPTLLAGGRTQLLDAARLSGTTAIEISHSTLLLGSSNASVYESNFTDRINDAATIALRGGILQVRARASLYTTESFGAVTLLGGNSMLDVSEGGTRVNQLDVTIASLARAANSRATVRFINIDSTPSGTARLFITSQPTLSNNIIGGWAVFEREFASYTAAEGVGALNGPGYAGYSPNLLNNGTTSDNIRIAAVGTTSMSSNRTINTLAVVVAGATTIDLGGNTLNLAAGGLIASNSTNDTAIVIQNGSLTAGGAPNTPADLYLHTYGYVNGNTDVVNRDVTISADIVNNGLGAVTLVLNAGDGRGTGLGGLLLGETTTLSGNNTYSGGTFVNAGRVTLANSNANGTTITATGAGNVTITGGAATNGNTFDEFATKVVFAGSDQIANTATVNIVGAAALNLGTFTQTLAGLTFNNTGGHTPTVSSSGLGKLTLTGNIVASGQNVGTISTISAALDFGVGTRTITVNPVEWNGKVLNPILPNLLISGVIDGANIVKNGGGTLRVTASNAYTGTFDLQAGGLSLGSNNGLSTGTLIIGNNTFLTSNADNRVLTNAYTVSGNFALRDVFNLTLNGPGTLTAGGHAINVELATKILTLGGVLSGASASITKTGDGILVLGNSNNTYGGTTTVSDGVLRYGALNAVPTTSAVTVNAGGMLDITSGGATVTLASLAGDSATAGGVVVTTASSGTTTLFAGGNNSNTDFGGVITAGFGAVLNFTKTGSGTMTLGGLNQYNGATTVANGRLIAKAVGGLSPLGTGLSLILGGGTTSGILQLGDSSAALNHTFTSIASSGTGTLNQIVSGNASMATLTFNLASTNTFVGNIGGSGSNEANLNLVKTGSADLIVSGSGASLYTGTTTVSGGKLFMDSVGAFPTVTTSLSLADGTEFSLRGTTNNVVTSYGFGATPGAKIIVGSSTGATLGFGIQGTGNSRLVLAAGQSMQVSGTLTTAIYVNGAPTDGLQYVLIDGADAGSLTGFGGTFATSPVVFNGGSFSYALALTSGVGGGGLQQWTLTPTAVPAAPDAWWKGDLTGIATGVWSATTVSGTGAPSNWDTDQASGIDAQVPPDSGSIVHFAATGATNFNTTLGANMTIQSLVFHTAAPAVSVGSSNGTNTLTLGNTVDASGILIETGAGNVDFSAVINLAMTQSWNIEDTARVLTVAGGLTGAFNLTVNDTAVNAGTLRFTGNAASLAGTLAMNAGSLLFEGNGSLATSTNVTLGTAAKNAVLFVGGAGGAATNTIIGGLSNGTFAGSRVVGGNAAMSTLTLGSSAGSFTFTGALGGGGTNENQFTLVKDGAGTQILNSATITYAGTTIVRNGTLQLGSAAVFAAGGSLSVLANAGATATFDFNGKSYTTIGDITLGGGAGGISRIFDTNATKGTLTLGGNIIYDALNDPGAATITANLNGGAANRVITVGDSIATATELTLSGTYSTTSDNNLTFNGAGGGTIGGNILLAWSGGTGATNDINFSSTGTWTITAKIEVEDDILINSGIINANFGESLDAADDVIIDGLGTAGSAIVNINSTSQVHTGNEFYIRNGGLVNIFGANGINTGTGNLLVGDAASATAASAGVLNYGANVTITPSAFQLGAAGNIGMITGTGTLNTAGNKVLANGEIGSGITLAGAGAIFKNTTGVVIWSGTRTATGATNLQEGELILDYTTNNNSKIGGVFSIGSATTTTNNGNILTMNGNASAATTQSVTSTTILPGASTVAINNGTGQTATLALGAFTRTAIGGIINFEYSTASAKATSTSPAGTLGWATVSTGIAGTKRFAAINGSGDIVQATLTTENNVTQWAAGQNIITSAALTGTADERNSIASLTFDAAANSTLNIAAAARLGITSGGIWVDSSVGAFTSTITGGEIYGNLTGTPGEFIVHQHNTAGTLTIASRIVNSSGLTKYGAGTLILSGNNSFLTSPTAVHVNQGTLRISGGSAIGDTTALYLRTGTTFDLNNSNETIGNVLTGSLGTIALGTGDLTINQTASSTFAGLFTGAAGAVIVFNGSGTNFNNTANNSGFAGTVVVNSGLFYLSGAAGRMNAATSFTLNKGANFLIDNNDDAAPNDRLSDTAAFVLNSADGAFSGETRPRGLAIRSDNNANESETIGALTFASGANYSSLEASGGTSSLNAIIASDWTRTNFATINVRGRNLGGLAGAIATQFKVVDANDATMIAANIGGGGAIGGTAKNVSILPWAIGENLSAALVDANMGNTFVSYVDNRGLVPLDLTNEYATYAAAGAQDNARESFTVDITGLSGKTINSLVLHNNSTANSALNVTGTGAGQTLINTSGAFLFTLNATATASTTHSIALGGFDGGIQVGATNEYVMWVVNPSSAATTPTLRATIASPLNSVAASLTKSGRGTLELTGINTYGGGTTINEGVLLIHDNDNVGVGNFRFAGGTLQLASDYVDDLGTLSSATAAVLIGGGTIDVVAANVLATNFTLTGTVGTLTKTGAGTLQLAGGTASTFSSEVLVNRGILQLNKTPGVNGLGTGTLSIGYNATASQPSTVQLLANDQIANSSHVQLRGLTTGSTPTLDVNGFSDAIGALTMGTTSLAGALVRIGTGGNLTVGGDITLNSDRNANDVDTNERNLVITGTGTIGAGVAGGGTLNLGGVNRVIRVQTSSTLGGNNDATIEAVVANGGIVKEGARRLYLTAANTYAGATTINDGTIVISAAENLGNGSVTNTLNINNSATLRNTAADVDLGVNRTVLLDGSGGTFEVTGSASNILTVSGVISGHEVAVLNKIGVGILELTAANVYQANTLISAGELRIGDGGTTGSFGTGGVILNGGSLAFNRSDSHIVSNNITGTGTVRQIGSGTTSLSGTNNYVGITSVNSGVLQFTQQVSLYNNNQANWTATDLVVEAGAVAAFNVGGLGEFTAADINVIKALGTATGGFKTGSTLGLDTTNAGGTFVYTSVIGNTNAGANVLGLTKYGSGALVVNDDNTYTGATTIAAGTLSVGKLANGGSSSGLGQSTLAASNLVFAGGALLYTGASVTTDRNFTINAGQTATIDVQNGGTILRMTGNTPVTTGGLTKTGAGTLTLANATYGYTGATTVSGGTLNTADDAAFAGNFVISGATFSPGSNPAVGTNDNGVGQATTTSTATSTFNTGSTFVFDFAATDFGGTASPTEWDFLGNAAGSLALTSGASYTLQIRSWVTGATGYGLNTFDADQASSIDLSTLEGGANSTASYRWLWIDNASGAGSLTGDGVDAGGNAAVLSQFAIDTSLFNGNNPFSGPASGHFWVSAYGNDLYINYSSVPEPGSLMLVGLAGLGLAAYRRRKRKLAHESGDATEGSVMESQSA